METRCQFWLLKKKRFCANSPINDSKFCGNHTSRSNSQWITCPIDPSHSVLEENLESHVKRCPLLKQAQSLYVQPFYQKSINAGEEENFSDSISSETKRSSVYSMSIPEFYELMEKIKSIHGQICGQIKDSFTVPKACSMWIKGEIDKKLPFQEKHVLQQASILGNLEEIGVVKNFVGQENNEISRKNGNESCDVTTVVEFGAGRGYLTQMLADCYGINRVFLVERKSYKLKADRSLRQKESLILERLRIDIADLNLNAVDSLRGTPYMAIGKHLCGSATDLTLRCCVRKQFHEEHDGDKPILKGLAIATCCHHLCQWKHYINKRYFSNLRISKEEFHAITWFTSWAVDANHGSDLPEIASGLKHHSQSNGNSRNVEEIVRNMNGVERAIMGFMCKEIIDMGRLVWIKECGLETRLVKYVPSTISPENHLLIARCHDRN